MKKILLIILSNVVILPSLANEIVYKASPEIQEFIRKSEGFSKCAHFDHKNYSIGYGTQRLEDGKQVPAKVKGKKFCITEERAVTLSNIAVEKKSDLIIAYAIDTGLGINQEMLDSLTSFAYNIGTYGAFKSTVIKHLQDKKCKKAVKSMLTYNKASGKELTGLTIRRKYEAKLLEQGCAKLTEVYADMKVKTKKKK